MCEFSREGQPRRIGWEDQTLERLIYLISHDLQAPVRALCTIPDWIEEDITSLNTPLPADLAHNIALMKQQSGRLSQMIADLMTYARVGRGQDAFDGDWAKLEESLRTRHPDHVRFALSVQLSGTVEIGEADLQTLLDALLSNAIKHHGRQSGQILLAASDTKTSWRMTIEDDGPGIAEQDRDRSLGIFATLKSRDKVEGTGMGLPIAVKICEGYGGHLTIGAGANGVGCKVTVELPR